jgi:hypothetical protein
MGNKTPPLLGMAVRRRIAPAAALVLIAVLSFAGACVKANPPTDVGSPVSPSSATGGTTTPTPSTTGPLAYTPDMKPIFDSDCVYCHGNSRPAGNYSMSTYTAVMRDVVPGNASSRLVTTTQSGGSMYRYWTGNRATKAALVRAWVVDNKAAQTR